MKGKETALSEHKSARVVLCVLSVRKARAFPTGKHEPGNPAEGGDCRVVPTKSVENDQSGSVGMRLLKDNLVRAALRRRPYAVTVLAVTAIDRRAGQGMTRSDNSGLDNFKHHGLPSIARGHPGGFSGLIIKLQHKPCIYPVHFKVFSNISLRLLVPQHSRRLRHAKRTTPPIPVLRRLS